MIVISGALVLVALVLLVLGLTMQELNFVYASILVSLVSFVFLVIGILQRRGEQPAAASGSAPEVTGDEQGDEAPAAAASAAKTGSSRPVPVRQAEQDGEEPADDEPEQEYDDEEELLEGGGVVLVVPGRPRYHVDGCRYLSGKSAEEIDVLDAREDGFTACGVCKPDDALEELDEPAEELEDEAPEDEELEQEEFEDEEDEEDEELEDEELEPVPAAPVKAARAGSTRATQPVAGTRRTKTPVRSTTARTRAVPVAPAEVGRSRAAKAAPGKPAAGRTAKAAPGRAPAARTGAARTGAARTGAAAQPAPAGRGRVVVIPDRGRFHVAQCRFVRDADDTQELSRAQAAKQGYAPCGVCKP